MTFTEAALQVLRLVGKPLHYKEITDVAIEKDLLSHVGKSPEVTMGARLAAMIKKEAGEGGLVRVKPGVFALAEWDESTVASGLADKTPALKKLSQREAEQQEAAANEPEASEEEPVEAVAPPEPSAVSLPVPSTEETDPEELGADELARAELTAAATEIFEVEDDDDEPILGGPEEKDDDEEDENGRRRRRRRRRGGREREDDDLPSYTVSDASGVSVSKDEASDKDGEREQSRGDQSRGERGRDRGGRDRDRGERDRSERDRDRGDRDRGDRDRGERERDRSERDGDDRKERPRFDELSGVELAGALEEQLSSFRRSGSASLKQLVEGGGRNNGRGRGRAPDNGLTQVASAAMRADNARRSAEGERPRFRLLNGGRVALTDWALDKDLLRLERDILDQVAKHQELMLKILARRISELPQRAASELCLTLLGHAGYAHLKPGKRPGASASELHLSGTYCGPLGDEAAAVVLCRDNKDVGRERVTELRGALHHYGPATLGVLVTTGEALSGAKEESQAAGATPVHLIDALKLAKLCVKSGVGVVSHSASLLAPDLELFEALRGQ